MGMDARFGEESQCHRAQRPHQSRQRITTTRWVNGFWIGLLVGTLCARFRDLPQIVASLMQIAFFVTPVMWKQDQLPREASWLVDINPLASLLRLVRDPLLGTVPERSAYLMGIGVMLAGFGVAIPFFARFRSRIVYWL